MSRVGGTGLTGPLAILRGPAMPETTFTHLTTDGDVTYTPAQVIGSVIRRSGLTSARTDTLPTAADLVAAIPAARAGSTLPLLVWNHSSVSLTVDPGAGGSRLGHGTVTANAGRLYWIRITSRTPAAYVMISVW